MRRHAQPADLIRAEADAGPLPVSAFPAGPELARLRRGLIRWYHKHGRDLPWRRFRDPYRIWISEIMLQQTTVAAVIPYFERFTSRFPTVHALAEASEHDVLRRWEGLGYYSRARNLRAAAQAIVADHGGTIPSDVAELRRLPGIGRYTAGAIASFAYDRRAPVVEANTLRVYARLLAFRGDVHSAGGQRVIWSFAEHAVPSRSPGDFNQAVMELGATICAPADPRCGECPMRFCCRSFAAGAQAEIPAPKRRPETTFLTEALVTVRRQGRYLLKRRATGERWAGLWDFLRVGLENQADDVPSNGRGGNKIDSRGKLNGSGHRRRAGRGTSAPTSDSRRQGAFSPAVRQRIERGVREQTGLVVASTGCVLEFQHSVTRYRIRLICSAAEYLDGAVPQSGEYRWVRPDEFAALALSMPARRFAQHLAPQGQKLKGQGRKLDGQ